MIQILLSGCRGHMGTVISQCAAERDGCTIAAGIDINRGEPLPFPVFHSPGECSVPSDVIIDFSHPSALDGLLSYAFEKNVPAVIATTGLSQEQITSIHRAAEKIPVFFTANMSMGINLMAELAKKASSILGSSFDIEIIEKHHNQKIDAPSGTALLLADEINHASGDPYQYIFERHSQRKKRDKKEIGIHSIRGGTIVGEHEILFAGRDELFSMTHTALSKDVFAVGALNAGIFLASQKPGLYTMKELIAQS